MKNSIALLLVTALLAYAASAKEICKETKGVPAIGMTKAEILASPAIAKCWGPIYRTNTTHTARFTFEQLVYRAGDWFGYIYLTNGVVTSIQY